MNNTPRASVAVIKDLYELIAFSLKALADKYKVTLLAKITAVLYQNINGIWKVTQFA
jgi:hypothetical protein